MVRVIACHHFRAQDVFTVEGEPVALCTAGDRILVATLQHCVEVWDLLKPGHLLHRFPTVDQAKQMIYCPAGDYVGTLEVRSSRQAVMAFVRVYLNWQTDMKGQPMRARIAGRVTPSSQSCHEQLEMIELPLKKQAFCISSCNTTGSLAVGLGNIVSIYRFCIKKHDISRRDFCDFEPLVEVTLNLSPHQLALCEDILACLAPNEFHVLKLIVTTDTSHNEAPKPKQQKQLENIHTEDKYCNPSIPFDLKNYVLKDDHFVVITFGGSQVERGCNTVVEPVPHVLFHQNLHPDSWPLTITLPGLEVKSDTEHRPPSEVKEVLGPSRAFPVVVEPIADSSWDASAVTLLYRRFSLDQEISSGLHSLHLLPVYRTDDTNTEEPKVKPKCNILLANSNHSNRFGLTCFFSSPMQGFLYDLVGPVHLVAVYPYTATARAVSLESHLLHAVTETGLETYTLRSMHSALSRLQDSKGSSLITLLPPPGDPVCLVGLQAFLHVEQLVLSDHNLVLLSAFVDESSSSQESDSNIWTVYSLVRPTTLDLYNDWLEVATAHRQKSPSTYISLLGEAHCMVWADMLTLTSPDAAIKELFQEACCLIGDFFLMSENIDENRMSVSYYLMSDHPIKDVVSRIMQFKSKVNPASWSLKILIEYLNHYLLRKEGITHAVGSEIADFIMDLYAQEEPTKFSQVILLQHLKGYSADKVMAQLKKRIMAKRAIPEDIISLIWLYVQQGHADPVPSLLSSLPKERLLEVFVQQHGLFVDNSNSTRLSSLAQIIRACRPDIFVEVMLQLVFTELFTVDNAFQMFQVPASGTTDSLKAYKIPHLKEFLEALLTSNRKTVWTTRAPFWLGTIYLARLKDGTLEKPSTQSSIRTVSLFGTRPMWLNMLSPFEGRSLREPCIAKKLDEKQTVVVCPCWQCNEDLLRLQSLMCHEFCPQEVSLAVLSALEADALLCGNLSLQVLASSSEGAVKLLADEHPLALIQYAKDSFADVFEKWKLAFDTLLARMNVLSVGVDKRNWFNQAVQMLLAHLAEVMTPSAFISLLPYTDMKRYLSHIRRCCQKHQASLLRDRIMIKGRELKGLV